MILEENQSLDHYIQENVHSIHNLIVTYSPRNKTCYLCFFQFVKLLKKFLESVLPNDFSDHQSFFPKNYFKK